MTQPQSSEFSTVLELDRSRTPRAFNAEEALWAREWKQICRLLRKHAEVTKRRAGAEPSARSSASELPYLAIAIFGSHGSGKSSLLATLAAEADRDEREPKGLQKDIPDGVRSLPIIRPNQLAPEESFLYAFLAAASEKERRPRTDKDSRRRDSSFLSLFQQEFQKVSEYLRVIDRDPGGQEYDALGVSLERLERHTSDVRLREAMGELITALATSLTGKETGIVLMPVDDADMSQSNLSDTLDTTMRYLYHPQLVPIFTFTGRQSEELMRAHFSRRLSGAEHGGAVDIRGSGEFEEKIALHYLARMFPVRNRVRLGASTVQLQKAGYVVAGGDEGSNIKSQSVFDLLTSASRLLFGETESRNEPQVRLALRPGELRKQLQLLDVLQNEKVHDLKEIATLESIERFERAAWSVLDAHRETLRQVGLHLDELYGYPSRGLRELILGTLLERPLPERRRNLERWRHQTEDQGAQILSLLALNAFRPALRPEEVVPGQVPKELSPGDPSDFDDYDISHFKAGGTSAETNGGSQGEQSRAAEERGVDADGDKLLGPDIVLVWFMTLWSGFYLPQVLARERHLVPRSRRPDGEAGEAVDSAALGVGWHVPRASALACGEALANRERRQTGMFLLSRTEANPFLGDDLVEVAGQERFPLLLAIWCFHGYEGGEPWLLVSLWRGLGLMSQLLELRPFLSLRNNEGRYRSEEDKKELVKNILKDHVNTSRYLGSLKLRRSEEEWTAVLPSADAADQRDSKSLFDELAEKTLAWLSEAPAVDTARDFVRRLHGDQLLGTLWPRLDAIYDDLKPKPLKREDFDSVENLGFRSGLSKWCSVLEDYWKESGCQIVLRRCPFVAPFFGEEAAFWSLESDHDVAATGAPAPGGGKSANKEPPTDEKSDRSAAARSAQARPAEREPNKSTKKTSTKKPAKKKSKKTGAAKR